MVPSIWTFGEMEGCRAIEMGTMLSSRVIFGGKFINCYAINVRYVVEV